jgi:hypothetical protein
MDFSGLGAVFNAPRSAASKRAFASLAEYSSFSVHERSMKKRAPPKLHTPQQRQREQERQFKPLALKIGWIAYEWNRLQETLAELFADAMGNHTPAFKVWHSVRSDLTQREMLKAAAEDKMAFGAESLKRVWAEILWVTNEATALSHKRNDALHAPFFFVTHADKIEVLPLHFFGNQKAKKLLSKDILKEFEWYKNSLAVLADYAMILHYAVRFTGDFSLPSRPALPSLGQKASPKRSPRRNKPK